jgi:phosphodiesterase/alkaline phosphatase D-like protein
MRQALAGAAAAAIAVLVLATTALAAGSPVVTTAAATSPANTTATLNGTVNPNGLDTQYAFQYGPTILYGLETTVTDAGSGTTDASVTANLTGLQPGTTYHYRIIAISSGGTTAGTDLTFTTTGTAPVNSPFTPVATTGTSTGANPSGAGVAGTVNPESLPTTYYFQFGTSNAYGYQTAPQSLAAGTTLQSVTAVLTGLASTTTYHYRLVATNADGTSVGNDATFTTAVPYSTPTTSKLSLFGSTGFVSPSGVAGVLGACIGPVSCTGSLKLSRSGVTLGTRSSFKISADNGGVIHVTLNAAGKALVRQRRSVRVDVTLTSGGKSAAGKMTLVQF